MVKQYFRYADTDFDNSFYFVAVLGLKHSLCEVKPVLSTRRQISSVDYIGQEKLIDLQSCRSLSEHGHFGMYLQRIRNYLCRSGKKKRKGGEGLITRNFIICTAHKMKEVEMDGARGLHVKDENACRMLMENLKERHHLEDSGVDGSLSILERRDGRMWIGVGTYGGLL